MRLTYHLLLAFTICAANSAVAQFAGDLDATFGNGGKVRIHVDELDELTKVLCASDGSIYFTGSSKNVTGGEQFNYIVGKLDSTGVLDSSFAENGILRDSFPGFSSSRIIDAILDTGGLYFLALGVDPAAQIDTQQLYIGKVKLSGSLDSSFATNGLYTRQFFGTYADGGGLMMGMDGKIVFCGTASDTIFIRDMPLIGRLHPNGVPDSSFGNTGMLVWDQSTNSMEDANSMRPAPNRHGEGGYLENVSYFGSHYYVSGNHYDGSEWRCITMMIDQNGDLVTSYGVAGTLIFSLPPGFNIFNVQHQIVNDRALVGVHVDQSIGAGDYFVQVIDTVGFLESQSSWDFTGGFDQFQDILARPDGSLLLAGFTKPADSSMVWYKSMDFGILAMDTVHQINSNFASSGYFSENFGTWQSGAKSIAFDGMGRLVVGGYATDNNSLDSKDFAFMRLWDDQTIGIPEVPQESFSVYPNPATDRLFLSGMVGQLVEVYSANGQMTFSGTYESHGIDIQSWESGVYFVRAKVGAARFVIAR